MAVEAAVAAESVSTLRVRFRSLLDRLEGTLAVLGLAWLVPMLRLAIGDRPREQVKALWPALGIPVLALVGFAVLWGQLAARIDTSLGAGPGPAAVWQEAKSLVADPRAERGRRGRGGGRGGAGAAAAAGGVGGARGAGRGGPAAGARRERSRRDGRRGLWVAGVGAAGGGRRSAETGVLLGLAGDGKEVVGL